LISIFIAEMVRTLSIKAEIETLRLTVSTLLEKIQDYPSLIADDACLDYAASLAEEQITPIEHAV
jgi:hypothetical protein